MMELAQVISNLCPGIDFRSGCLLRDDGVGAGPYIFAWNDPRPQPTPEQIAAAEPLAAAAAISAQVNIERETRIAAGVPYAGNVYDSDRGSLLNITATVAAVAAGVPLPDGFTWRTKDNKDIPMDAKTLIELGATILAYCNACYKASWKLKAGAVADPGAVDIAVGWPT